MHDCSKYVWLHLSWGPLQGNVNPNSKRKHRWANQGIGSYLECFPQKWFQMDTAEGYTQILLWCYQTQREDQESIDLWRQNFLKIITIHSKRGQAKKTTCIRFFNEFRLAPSDAVKFPSTTWLTCAGHNTPWAVLIVDTARIMPFSIPSMVKFEVAEKH